MATSERPTDPLLVVLAGNRQEFAYWCRENERTYRDRKVTYIDRAECLMGMRGFNYVIYGTFWSRRDALELYSTLLCREGTRYAPSE